jgi:3-hydroxyisobutyrate dehydrogenase-like beta-hydroxyacid dehydrogenase
MTTREPVTGFLHPGAMGSSLAATCRGTRLWCPQGRSATTEARATASGLHAVGSLRELVERSHVIVSVCPPASAGEVASSVAALGFSGIYVDANAIAPVTTRSIGTQFARFVDGGVVGPPARAAGTTRLYLSGAETAEVADLWAGSLLETRFVSTEPGAASAVKMCFAAWTKVSAALLFNIRALAVAEGVNDAIVGEWATSLPGLPAQAEASARNSGPKAWRFGGEMHEIGDTFAANDLPDGFARAAADVYDRLADCKDATDVTLQTVIDLLLRS